MTAERFGILGLNEIERDDEGFVVIPVVIQESGLYFGASPPELRIHCVLPVDDDEFSMAYVAMLNRRTDLPFYLAEAKIRVFGPFEKVTDAYLNILGITPLEEEL